MIQPRHGDAGVTLIEVLVSLAIFAVIGVAGLTVLDTVARTGERTDGRLERLAEIDRAFLTIRRDLAQMTDTETRLENDELTFRRLTETGSFRVSYRLDDTFLVREVQTDGPTPVPQNLLPGVVTGDWRVMDAGNQWRDEFLPDTPNSVRLKAAELTLNVIRDEDMAAQSVTRLFVLPAGQSQ
ncbi:MAG TPA: prepilin-type N-terminal cleavage/methylation domain-containing protein [Marivita sp.]|nr:prepilin-type N-terminal cleavage/methylation domain-containing protein [Marivita sp.]